MIISSTLWCFHYHSIWSPLKVFSFPPQDSYCELKFCTEHDRSCGNGWNLRSLEGCAISYVGLIESEPWMKYLNETSKVSSSNYATEYLKLLGRTLLTGECFISEMSHFTFCYALGVEKLLCMHEWSFQQIIMRTLQVFHDAVHLSFKNKSIWDALFNWVELFFAAHNENVYLLLFLLRVRRDWRRILCWKLCKSLLH